MRITLIMISTSYTSGRHQWKMEFNPDLTKQATEVIFSCNKSTPNLIFNGTVVTNVNEQKHLGLILDSGLSFKKHLTEKS